MLTRLVYNRLPVSIKAYCTAAAIENHKNFKVSETEKREFNAEATACRNELSDAALSESRQFVSSLSPGKVTNITQQPGNINLPGVFYVLGFDRGRKMSDSDKAAMSRLLPQVEQRASSLSVTDLAIIAAAMHRAQLPVTDRRLMVSLTTALSKCQESSLALRILKILDLSIRRSLPPESLPTDDQLDALATSLSRLMFSTSLSPLYATRVMRFWQKLRIITPDIDDATNKFFDTIIANNAEKRPLKKWRIKDISQAAFTCGFFAYPWSRFADAALEEIEHRLDSQPDPAYLSEIANFPDAYFQSVFGLLAHSNCAQQERIKKLVQENEIFSRAPSAGARSIEAWHSVRVACGLDVGDSKTTDLDASDLHSSQRLTGRQYMALQVADAARAAFPTSNVRIAHLLPAFATEAKVDVVIEKIEVNNRAFSVSLLPLPELACFRRLAYSKNQTNGLKQLVSFYRPQGSELLRLRSIVAAGLVDRALPILWPTWRSLRENNRHIYIRNVLTKLLSQTQH